MCEKGEKKKSGTLDWNKYNLKTNKLNCGWFFIQILKINKNKYKILNPSLWHKRKSAEDLVRAELTKSVKQKDGAINNHATVQSMSICLFRKQWMTLTWGHLCTLLRKCFSTLKAGGDKFQIVLLPNIVFSVEIRYATKI